MCEVEEMKVLDPIELQSYCSRKMDVSSREEVWKALLQDVFPEIHEMTTNITFPDFEKDERRETRNFLPMREIYTQMLAVSTNTSILTLVNSIINSESLTNIESETINEFCIYFQMLSFLLACNFNEWKCYLVERNDILVQVLPFTLEEMKEFLFLTDCDSFHLWKRYFSIDDPLHEDWYVFLLACQNGWIDAVRILLSDKRVDPTDNNNSAIGLACENGHVELVKLLYADSRVYSMITVNHLIRVAADKGHVEVVRFLLRDERFDHDIDHGAMIQKAAFDGQTEIVRLLLSDPRVNPANGLALYWASTHGYADIVEILLKDGRSDPSDGPLRRAVENAHTNVIRVLLGDERVDPAANGNAAIREACRYGNVATVRILLSDERVNPADNNNAALRKACRYGNVATVRILLEDERVDPTANNNAALRKACKYNNAEVVRLLLACARGNEIISTFDFSWIATSSTVAGIVLKDKRLTTEQLRRAYKEQLNRVSVWMYNPPYSDLVPRAKEVLSLLGYHNAKK